MITMSGFIGICLVVGGGRHLLQNYIQSGVSAGLASEGFAAVRAARANRVQTSLNLANGSALATIGLTIPAVAAVVAVVALGRDLELGLSMRTTVILALTLLVAALTLGRGLRSCRGSFTW